MNCERGRSGLRGQVGSCGGGTRKLMRSTRETAPQRDQRGMYDELEKSIV